MAWLHNFILQASTNNLDLFNEFGPAFQPDPLNAIIHPYDTTQLHVYGTPAQETRQAVICGMNSPNNTRVVGRCCSGDAMEVMTGTRLVRPRVYFGLGVKDT